MLVDNFRDLKVALYGIKSLTLKVLSIFVTLELVVNWWHIANSECY